MFGVSVKEHYLFWFKVMCRLSFRWNISGKSHSNLHKLLLLERDIFLNVAFTVVTLGRTRLWVRNLTLSSSRSNKIGVIRRQNRVQPQQEVICYIQGVGNYNRSPRSTIPSSLSYTKLDISYLLAGLWFCLTIKVVILWQLISLFDMDKSNQARKFQRLLITLGGRRAPQYLLAI